MTDHARADHGGEAATYRRTLEAIDTRATTLITAVRDDETLEDEATRTALRHLREIRAEVESTRLELCDSSVEQIDSRTSAHPSSDGFECHQFDDDRAERTRCGDRPDDRCTLEHADVPMVVRRGPLVTTVLGPDPIAFERTRRAERTRDENPDHSRDETHRCAESHTDAATDPSAEASRGEDDDQ